MKTLTVILVLLNLVVVKTNAQVNLQYGLVAYYPFNGNSNDESGNLYNGIVHGAVLTNNRFGQENSAYSFDGIDDFIETSFVGILGSGPRTISMWLKSPSSDIAVREALGYGGNEAGKGISIRLGLNYNGPGPHINVSNALNLYNSSNDDQWHHYVWIVPQLVSPKLTDVVVYKDGIKLTSITYWRGFTQSESAIINTTESQKVHIGHWGDITSGYNSFFLGDIDEVRLYNRVLTIDEIGVLASVPTNLNNEHILSDQNRRRAFFYPNPAQNAIYFNIEEFSDANAFIYNLEGKLFISNKVTNKDFSIDVSPLKKGIYLLKLVESNKISVNLFIKN
jgi:hypothetical protein